MDMLIVGKSLHILAHAEKENFQLFKIRPESAESLDNLSIQSEPLMHSK